MTNKIHVTLKIQCHQYCDLDFMNSNYYISIFHLLDDDK